VGRGQEEEAEAAAAEEEEEEKEAEEEAEEEEAADLPGRCGYIHPTMATSENKTARLAAGHVESPTLNSCEPRTLHPACSSDATNDAE
jgi:hypothetical protein